MIGIDKTLEEVLATFITLGLDVEDEERDLVIFTDKENPKRRLYVERHVWIAMGEPKSVEIVGVDGSDS